MRHLLRVAAVLVAHRRGEELDEGGDAVAGYIFHSPHLAQLWPMLDAFEEAYDRVPVTVNAEDGSQIAAWIYQIQPA
nr:gamma-glutamylcyclotransferase family protein [Candidatus Pantoea persica]